MGDVDGTIGAWGFARGGMGAISRALGLALEEAGGTIVTGAGIDRFLTEGGRVTGVALDNGDIYSAPVVASYVERLGD
jgi:phytoene dehydrogenase-like protein